MFNEAVASVPNSKIKRERKTIYERKQLFARRTRPIHVRHSNSNKSYWTIVLRFPIQNVPVFKLEVQLYDNDNNDDTHNDNVVKANTQEALL